MPALGVAAEVERRIAAINGSVSQSLVREGAGVKPEIIEALDRRIAQEFEALARLIDAQAAGAMWSEADRATLKQIAQVFGKFRSAVAQTIDIKSSGLATASSYITLSESSYTDLNRLIGDLVKRQHAGAQREVVQAEQVSNQSRVATGVGVLVAIALSALATWWCVRLIADSIEKVEGGSALVHKSGDTLGQTVTSVKRVTPHVARVRGEPWGGGPA
jgi:methyl-accepting chemotaxis protein